MFKRIKVEPLYLSWLIHRFYKTLSSQRQPTNLPFYVLLCRDITK